MALGSILSLSSVIMGSKFLSPLCLPLRHTTTTLSGRTQDGEMVQKQIARYVAIRRFVRVSVLLLRSV